MAAGFFVFTNTWELNVPVRKTPSKGGKPDKLMRDALIIALKRHAEKGKPTRYLQIVADKLVNKAIEGDGDVIAIKEIFDRVDGRVPTSVALPEDVGEFNMTVTWGVSS